MQKANNACGVSFGSAKTAMQQNQNKSPANVLPSVKAYMENIVATATTNNATLDALAESNARLYATTKKQHTMIEYLRMNNAMIVSMQSGGGGGFNTGGNNGRLLEDNQNQPTAMASAAATPEQPALAVVMYTLNWPQETILQGWEQTQIGVRMRGYDGVGKL